MRIEPWRTLTEVEKLYDATSSKRQKAILLNFRKHMVAEVSADIDGIMATMAPHTHYHDYGLGFHHEGREQTRKFYTDLFEHEANVTEIQIHRIAVADWGIAMDGTINLNVSPKAAHLLPIADERRVDGHFLWRCRHALFLPHDENCLMLGEDAYGDPERAEIIPLKPDEIVRQTDVGSAPDFAG